MFVVIITDNITIPCSNYFMRCYSKFICYHLLIEGFVFYNPWQCSFFPPLPPSPLALLTLQQELSKYIEFIESYNYAKL